jgi:hypothetical protein
VPRVEVSGTSHASASDWLLPSAVRTSPSCSSSLSLHLLSLRDEGVREAAREPVHLTSEVTSCFSGSRPKSGTPPGYSPKYKNEPEKCFRISKSAQKRTRNEPERTQARIEANSLSHLESVRPLGMVRERIQKEPETNPRQEMRSYRFGDHLELLVGVLVAGEFSRIEQEIPGWTSPRGSKRSTGSKCKYFTL